MSEKEIAVEIGHLNKYFDELKVLDDVSLSVENGEFVSVIGVSGCGKSTLIRIIGGLEQPTEGTVLVKGSPVKKPSKKTGFALSQKSVFWFISQHSAYAFYSLKSLTFR